MVHIYIGINVVINGFVSDVSVTSGVPQGSVLAQYSLYTLLILLLYITALADNLKLYRTVNSVTDCELIQDALTGYGSGVP